MLTRYNMSHRNFFNYTSFGVLSSFGILNYWYLYPRIVDRNKKYKSINQMLVSK